jgi:hypothetical protein
MTTWLLTRRMLVQSCDWNAVGLALLVITALGVVGIPLTIRNYRSVYR